MHYELNVSLHGEHLFATASRSITTEEKALRVLKLFRAKFPEGMGFEVSASIVQPQIRNVTEELAARIR